MTRPIPTSARVPAPAPPWSDAPGVRRPSLAAAPWGVLLALAAALLACRAREGDRCVCADDCRDGLLCVASGRVLAAGDCAPAVGQDVVSPGVCLPVNEAAEGDDGGGLPEVFMDLGSKHDFEPGPPPDPETGTDSGTAGTDSGTAGTGMTGSSSDGGTTDATGTSSGGSSSGTTDATGSSSSGGGTTDATGSSSSGGSSSGSSGSTGVGT